MHVNRTLRATADLQAGYFTARQAQQAGYSPELQRYHANAKNWLRISRALYRLPDYPDTLSADFIRGSLWAAGQSLRRTVVVSHRSAAYYYGWISERPPRIDLTVSDLRSNPEDEGYQIHWERLEKTEYQKLDGFRITTPLRTLRDLQPDLKGSGCWEDVVLHAQRLGAITEADGVSLIGNRSVALAGATTGRDQAAMFPQPTMRAAWDTAGQEGRAMSSKTSHIPAVPARSGGWTATARSFTLVEMLVVIAIIAVLAGLLLPSLSSSLNMAYLTKCRENMRQAGFGFAQYLDDYNDWFPPATINNAGVGMFWFQDFYFAGNYSIGKMPYLSIKWRSGDYFAGTILDCPSQDVGISGVSMDYTYNLCLGNQAALNNVRVIPKRGKVARPSKLIVLSDTQGKSLTGDVGTGYSYFEAWCGREWYDAFHFRHLEQVNALCVDLHVGNTRFDGISFNNASSPFNTRNP